MQPSVTAKGFAELVPGDRFRRFDKIKSGDSTTIRELKLFDELLKRVQRRRLFQRGRLVWISSCRIRLPFKPFLARLIRLCLPWSWSWMKPIRGRWILPSGLWEWMKLRIVSSNNAKKSRNSWFVFILDILLWRALTSGQVLGRSWTCLLVFIWIARR